MGIETHIEWCDATWNPWIGCTKISPGCANCYAERGMKRFGKDFSKVVRTSDVTFRAPMKWKGSKKIFVCSWSDFFHPSVPDQWRSDAYGIMSECQWHTFIILTKRPGFVTLGNMELRDNIMYGVTVESGEQIQRIPEMCNMTGSTVLVSVEPMLGPVDISEWAAFGMVSGVICGGESGPAAREMKRDWVLSLNDQCVSYGIPFFFKQWGEWRDGVKRGVKKNGSDIDGVYYKELSWQLMK